MQIQINKTEKFSKITENEILVNLINLKQLVFEVTDSCNLKCKYCGYSDLYEGYDDRENLKFPFQRAKLIIDYLHNIWKQYPYTELKRNVVISFYGGEPLLNMLFIKKVIYYIESLPLVGRSFEYGMTTNALLLNRYMDFLARYDFQLLISLDGDEKGQSYRIDAQGRNSFHRVYKNVILLRDKYPDFYKKKVCFNSVIHDRNEVDSTVYFIKSHLGKIPRISILSTFRVRKEKRNEFMHIYNKITNSIEQSPNCNLLEQELFTNNPKTAMIVDYIYKHSGNVFYNYSQLCIQEKHLPIPPTGTCIPFSKKMFITVKGRILQCEKIDHQYTLGYITDESVDLDIKQIALKHNKHIFKYIELCKKCALHNRCIRCIYQEDNKTIKEKSTCVHFITKDAREIEISSILSYLNKYPDLYERILKETIIGG